MKGVRVEGVLNQWLDAWGYSAAPGSLHLHGDSVDGQHPYRTEIRGLLDPKGAIRAKAVFDVEGVPTICFLESNGEALDNQSLMRGVRERAWNQNLVSIVLVVDDTRALAAPTSLPEATFEEIEFKQAKPFGAFSRADIQSGEVFSRHAQWFAPENRVDRKLLSNLGIIVDALTHEGLDKGAAQLLMAQVMFVAYLEHRGIVGEEYRKQREVGSLFDLAKEADRKGMIALMRRVKKDFNGDLLEPDGGQSVWSNLSDVAFQHLNEFLSHVDMADGQKSFWRYDFRFIPVELISGIYESFLAEDKRDVGAYYTPRHLAALAVDQAFAGSADILAERVLDGACGSGILLTTAYRRMLAYGEAKTGAQWPFAKRVELLQQNIFGSDINESACRVTAFSLYLCVLENLQPADLFKLTAQGKATLPTLDGHNIVRGAKGDFFSDKNPLVKRGNFTLLISNPPWLEPSGKQLLSSDVWAAAQGQKIPRRQVCLSYMLRAMDAVDPVRGRFCFILPVSSLGAETSQPFVKEWLRRCELDTVINFGDLRKLLFENAKQPTLVVAARPRRSRSEIELPETFEYWTPKADVSLAFGRLTLHGTDRHTVQTAMLANDNSVLTTLYWGTPQDQATIASLEMRGQIGDLLDEAGWQMAKGFHLKDSSVSTPVSVESIASAPYLDARKFALHGPLLDEGVLERFPQNVTHVAKLSDKILGAFKGPRIVFKDGMTSEREICAGFSTKRFSFNSSTTAIVAPPKDADLLRFLSVYLHSDLVRYLLLLTAYQISFERERVSLLNVKRLPFVHPRDHSNPPRAAAIVAEVAEFVREMEASPMIGRQGLFDRWRTQAEKLISEYFGLTAMEKARVQEMVTLVVPSMQPPSYARLVTPLQMRTSDRDLQRYVKALLAELAQWRDAMGGAGDFEASLTIGSAQACGALAVIRLDVQAQKPAKSSHAQAEVADQAVAKLVQTLQTNELLPVQLRENLYLAADVVVRHGNSLYLIKPMVRRMWLQAQAFRDAERIVRYVQEQAVQ
ncbi:HsdM family class I SAM-dependent methyltransferase [Hydrogenophaga sp.]|uniref:HsdM family class I SAM-dependent methyltransferase n=1 Tax=Hydrogenophaga sp. TaxID=1904254 RepID=UPI003D0C6F68